MEEEESGNNEIKDGTTNAGYKISNLSLQVQDNYHHGYMVEFPYHAELGGYFIHTKKQREEIWGQLISPRSCCSGINTEERIWKAMFWFGISFAFLAIVIAFVKEEFEEEDKKEEDTEHMILYLSITELVLAAISIIISLSKHSIKYNTIIELQKNIRTVKQNVNERNRMSHRRKLRITIAIVWLVFILIFITGFTLMHFYNHDSHKELTYTKYTTVTALFLIVVLDAVINDVINDAYTQATSDQYRLVIHQLTLELNWYFQQTGNKERGKEIENFLNKSELFSVYEKQHFVKTGRVKSLSTIYDDIKVQFDKGNGEVVLTGVNVN